MSQILYYWQIESTTTQISKSKNYILKFVGLATGYHSWTMRFTLDCVFQYGVKVSLANFARRYMFV